MGLFWRIILAISLFAVVVLVSYIKTDLSAARIETNPVSVQEPIDQTSDAGESDAVEKSALNQSDSSEFEDRNLADSTTAVIDTVPAQTLPPSAETVATTPAKKSENSTKPAQKAAPAPVDSAKLVIEYFQKKLASLPDDLTSYERRVAIKEIRDETCEKYAITPARFNEMAREKNLAYP